MRPTLATGSPLAWGLLYLLLGCASAPPLAPGITGGFVLETMDGRPLPSEDGVLDGSLQLRGNRSFTWRFTMVEEQEGGGTRQVPVVFEGRFRITGEAGGSFRVHLTRRDRAAATRTVQEEIEGILAGETLTFETEELTAVFRRR